MSSLWDQEQQGRKYEGWAFTFCKAGFLVLLFGKFSLLMLSGLSVIFYVLAWRSGVREWRCFLKPPWVVLWWAAVFGAQVGLLIAGRLGFHPVDALVRLLPPLLR